MASIIDTTRIIDLPTKSSLSDGDVFVVDNENGATSKIPATAVSGSSTAGLVAEEYRDSRTYKVGEYCIHVEAGIPKFYKCTTEIATAESWTPAHWEGTDAGTEITDLNQSLMQLISIEPVSYTTSTTVAANSGANFSVSALKTGYTPLGVVGYDKSGTNQEKVTVNRMILNSVSGNINGSLFNPTSSSITITAVNLSVLYMKNL